MKWLDKWVEARCQQALSNNGINRGLPKVGAQEGLTISMGQALKQATQDPTEETVRFELTPAVGGRILTVRTWNRQRDSNDTVTYVIPSGEDLGERVAKIINLQMYK